MNDRIETKFEDGTELKSAKGVRWLGLVGIATGAALLWFFMFKPLQDAQNQASELFIVRKAAFGGIALTVFGLLAIIFGDGFVRMIPDMNSNLKDIPWHYWLTLAFILVLSVSLWFWFEGRLESLGYGM